MHITLTIVTQSPILNKLYNTITLFIVMYRNTKLLTFTMYSMLVHRIKSDCSLVTVRSLSLLIFKIKIKFKHFRNGQLKTTVKYFTGSFGYLVVNWLVLPLEFRVK